MKWTWTCQPGEVTSVLVVSEGLVVERLGPAVGHELQQLRLVARESRALIQLVSWHDESALEALHILLLLLLFL